MSNILTAVQPTNGLTLGNYLGAVKGFKTISEQPENVCIAFVADLHAITVRHDPKTLREQTLKVLSVYLASGIDPEKTTLFVQSMVPQHGEMAVILNCYAYIGELERMTQFKDKRGKQENVNVGLFDYPVLMAGDVLLYDTDFVPVGEDQKQHLELTRTIAERVNSLYGPATFRVPKPMILQTGARVMSLQNPQKKMSKSDPNENATIFLDDPDEKIEKKIKRAVMDSGSEVTETLTEGVFNLLEIGAAITGQTVQSRLESYLGKGYGLLKADTAELVVQLIRPIREESNRWMKDGTPELQQIILKGQTKASGIAQNTLSRLKEKLGFYRV